MAISDELSKQLQKALVKAFVWPTKASEPYINAISDKTLRWCLILASQKPTPQFDDLDDQVCSRLVQLLDLTVTNFSYGDPTIVSNEQQTLSGSVLCNNTTDASQSANPVLRQSVVDTFTWGITESITIAAEAEYTAGLPSILGSKLTLKMSLTAGSHQSWTETNTQEFTVSGWVNLPPHSNIEASMIVTIEKLAFPWTAVCELTPAAATKPSDITNALAAGWPPGTTLDQFLPGDDESRTATGTLTATAGMRAEISFTPAGQVPTETTHDVDADASLNHAGASTR